LKSINDIIDKDSSFLRKLGYCDYSILIAIEFAPSAEDEELSMKIAGPQGKQPEDKRRKYSIVSWMNKENTQNLLNIKEVDTFLQSKSRHIFYSDKD